MRDHREHPQDNTATPGTAPGRRAAGPAPIAAQTVREHAQPTPAMVLALQRTIGNAAVTRLLEQQRHTHDAPCGHHEPHREQAPAPAPVQRSTVPDVLRSPGRPLAGPLRAEMESRLGADFSSVRVHDDPAAARSAAEVGARAYTSGEHVVIGRGGKDGHTLAHELTHVIQQRQGPVAGTQQANGLKVSDPADRFEREAEAVAREVMSGPAPGRATGIPGRGGAAEQGHADHAHGSRAVQRTVYQVKTNPPGGAIDGNVMADLAEFAECLDSAVRLGWSQATQNPTDPAWAKLDGYLGRWALQWETYMDPRTSVGDRQSIASMVPAMCGYAVESLATKAFLANNRTWNGPKSNLGFTVVLQEPNGNTRPDVVLKHEGKSLAWYDITSEKSRGHILDKDGSGWWTMPYVAEICYPPVTAEIVAKNSEDWIKDGRPAIFDDPKLLARQWMERARFDILMAQMRAELAGGDPSPVMAARAAADEVGANVNESRRREHMRAFLALFRVGALAACKGPGDVKTAVANEVADPRFAAHTPQPKDTAAVLEYLGKSHTAFGFRKGDNRSLFAGLSEKPGIVWLQECATFQQRAVSDADAVAYVKQTWPDAVELLKKAGLVT